MLTLSSVLIACVPQKAEISVPAPDEIKSGYLTLSEFQQMFGDIAVAKFMRGLDTTFGFKIEDYVPASVDIDLSDTRIVSAISKQELTFGDPKRIGFFYRDVDGEYYCAGFGESDTVITGSSKSINTLELFQIAENGVGLATVQHAIWRDSVYRLDTASTTTFSLYLISGRVLKQVFSKKLKDYRFTDWGQDGIEPVHELTNLNIRAEPLTGKLFSIIFEGDTSSITDGVGDTLYFKSIADTLEWTGSGYEHR
ncbi:MAG TPA: hypothetical protein VGD40_23155 [Chryseosolibacter sp.]